MTVELCATDVGELASTLSSKWSALGATIAYINADQQHAHIPEDAYDDRSTLEEFLLRALQTRQVVSFEVGCGGLAVAIPLSWLNVCTGAIACFFPAGDSNGTGALLDVFIDNVQCHQRLSGCEAELTSMSEQLAQSYEEISLVYKIGRELKVTESPEEFFEHFAAELTDIIQAGTITILVRPPDTDDSMLFLAGNESLGDVRLEAVARYLMRHCGARTAPLIMTDLSAHPALARIIGHGDSSMVVVPLRTNEKVMGVIVAMDKTSGDTFDSTDAKLLNSIAEQTATFFDNRFLIQDLNELLIAMLTSLVNAIDAKDPYTSGHSQRVAVVAQAIAESLSLSAKQITESYLAGLLHDVGKIGIADSVLAKPGRLNAQEYGKVKQHPIIGAKIVGGVKQLRSIIPGILCHHERHDGSGYPEGLRDDQIPLLGSIVALADCFDAVTSDRTYREALSFEQARDDIVNSTLPGFSPEVVDALERCSLDELKTKLQDVSSRKDPDKGGSPVNWLHMA